MHFSGFQWFLIAATIAVQAGIVTVMARRKARSAFPFFFNFVVFSLLAICLQAGAAPYMSPTVYFYTFWAIMGMQTALTFAVIFEAFVHILKPYSALVDLGKLLFRWALVFLALVSVLSAAATTGPAVNRLCAAIQISTRCAELMECGLLLLFALFESRLGLSWRCPAASIILGLGANASLALLLEVAADYLRSWSYVLDVAGAVVGAAVYLAWYLSFALPQPARRTVQDSPTRLILQRWNEAVLASPLIGRRGEVLAMSPVESFLPGVERTVERVMARKMMH